MERIVLSRSAIKLFLVIALSLALSCVTAPGIRTSDVAELHYGDREGTVVEKLGDGTEILYFVLDVNQYRYRLYTTQYTKDVYALLFMNEELVAVHNEKQDFSECLNIEASASWEKCLSDMIVEMRLHDISLGSHDFSHGIQTEQREQAERDSWRAGTLAVAVPLTMVLPGIVPMYCFLSCGEGCKDPGARPGDYQDSCIGKMASTLGQAINIIHGNISYESIDKALGQIQSNKRIIYNGAIDEKTINDHSIIDYSWGCIESYAYLSIKLGLTNGMLKWSWFKLQPMHSLSRPGGQANYVGCEGTWSDLKKCASMNQDATRDAWDLKKDIRTYCPNAELGHADAQAYIGDLHYLGAYGIERNVIQAFVWYSLASTNGNAYATVQLEKIVDQLSPEQLVVAQHQLEQWEPGQCENDLTVKYSKLYDQYLTLCREADIGHTKAQLELGRIYWRRNDISDNRSKSYMWYMLAATSSLVSEEYYDESSQKRAAIEVEYKRDKVLSDEELTKAMQLLSIWKPGQCEYELLPADTGN
jgi:hypothetical protein